MSKRAEIAAKERYPDDIIYPSNNEILWKASYEQEQKRYYYVRGYEQAEKDTIFRIREQVERWMPENSGEERIKGERVAFNSVLNLLKEMEEE